MTSSHHNLLRQAYAAFNRRDIDAVLALLQPGVRWANGWEGGFVTGQDAVRDYWTRQWKEIDPHVEPVALADTGTGEVEVTVHQVAKDVAAGAILFDGVVIHVYTFDDGLISQMEIREAEQEAPPAKTAA